MKTLMKHTVHCVIIADWVDVPATFALIRFIRSRRALEPNVITWGETGLQTGGAERASTALPSTSQLMTIVIDRVLSFVLTLKFSTTIATKNVPIITLTARLWCRRFKSRKDDKVSLDKIT